MRSRPSVARFRFLAAAALALASAPAFASGQAGAVAAPSYLLFVTSEATDQVALLRFSAKGLLIEHRTPVKIIPGDPAGPPDLFVGLDGKSRLLSSAHGFPDSELASGPRVIAVTPRGRSYYVATNHGFSGGELLEMRIARDSSIRESQPSDTIEGREPLGGTPASVQVAPDGIYAWVAVSGPDGKRGWFSVVYLPSMVEVARVAACARPSGSRFAEDGARLYATCPEDNALLELDTRSLAVTRRLQLDGKDSAACRPAQAEPGPDGSRILVACEGSDEVLEVDAASWSVVRRIAVAGQPAGIALTSDGRIMVVADRAAQAVSVIDLASGGEEKRIRASGPQRLIAELRALTPGLSPLVPHVDQWPASRVPVSLAVSPDDRYAFVAISRPGALFGAVDVIDLRALTMVATIDVGPQPGGIAVWKMEPPRP